MYDDTVMKSIHCIMFFVNNVSYPEPEARADSTH